MEIKNLNIAYSDKVIYENFNITFEEGTISCVLGESGIGKTTLLNCIADISNYKGDIIKDGKIAYVFQSSRLINTISIKKNLEFVMDKKDDKLIEDTLTSLEILDLINKKPTEISGGEASRVSIARALVCNPKVLLLDEPFKDLDVALKHKLLKLLKQIILEKNLTVIYVTHDIDEAIFMADRIVVLRGNPVNVDSDILVGFPHENRELCSNSLDGIRHLVYNSLVKQWDTI